MEASGPPPPLSLSSEPSSVAPSAPRSPRATILGPAAKPPLPSPLITMDSGSGLPGFLLHFTRAQYLLDQNRLLLHEINLNQESKVPVNITRNVFLINELNDNILKIVDLYSSISDFCEQFGVQSKPQVA